jgi:mono/diheme cytochrome c family protein
MRGFLYFCLGFLVLSLVTFSIAGRRGSMSRKPPVEIFPDMDRQNKVRPQTGSSFSGFADGMGSRLPVAGTVSRSSHFEDIPLNTGHLTGQTNFVDVNPLKIDEVVMARGRERYAISCVPCHGPIADGNGVTKKLGMAVVANLHDKRIVSMPDGEIFSVITNGRNNMGSYGDKIVPEDRWAIIAYVRALQLARLGTADDVPAAQRGALK